MVQKFLVAVALGFVFMSQTSFAAPTQTTYTYRQETGDVGVIEKTGTSRSQAFELAADECYSRRAQLFMARRGHLPEEVAEEIILSCANMTW
jgi:hypothetical protein